MSAFVTVRRFSNVEPARVAWSFLVSAGIAAELDDHLTCSNVWTWSEAIRIALRVPAEQAEDALAALAQVDQGAFADPDAPPLERTWENRVIAALMLLYGVGLLVTPLLFALTFVAAALERRRRRPASQA